MPEHSPAARCPDPVVGVEYDLHAWREAHPTATFAEIEAAVEERMRAVRAQWVRALASETAAAAAMVPPVCPHCGGAMVTRGTHPRTLTVTGDHPVTLTRPYTVCPICGTGLSPP